MLICIGVLEVVDVNGVIGICGRTVTCCLGWSVELMMMDEEHNPRQNTTLLYLPSPAQKSSNISYVSFQEYTALQGIDVALDDDRVPAAAPLLVNGGLGLGFAIATMPASCRTPLLNSYPRKTRICV